MISYRCWIPDEGQTLEDAQDVLGIDPEHAAEDFAEQKFHRDEPFEHMVVAVRDLASTRGTILCDVEVEAVPHFRAVRMKVETWP